MTDSELKNCKLPLRMRGEVYDNDILDADGLAIGGADEKYTKLIVTAVNSHQLLVDALELCIPTLEYHNRKSMLCKVEAALKAARGE